MTDQEIAEALQTLAPCLADGGLCDEAARRILALAKGNRSLRKKLRASRRKYEFLMDRCALLGRQAAEK